MKIRPVPAADLAGRLAFVALVLVAACGSGCQSIRAAASRPPAASVKAGALEFAQDGAAATPGTASQKETRVETVIPAGAQVTAHPDGRVSWTNAEPVAVVSASSDSSATGPAAFTPPAPPTPTEEAAGRASLWMRLGLVAGIAAGVFGLVKGWDFVAYGGGAIAAACVAGLALASVPPWLWAVFGIGAAACVIGPIIWHTKLKPRATPSPALPG